jgi:outer membrane biosynthesis protein TonB
MPGVAVEGGGSIVTLPSFGSDGDAPSLPNHSASGPTGDGAEITIVATSRSGGAFNFYGTLKGDKVYTIYINTTLGTAVMQFADPASVAHPNLQDLTAPQPMRAALPPGLPHARMVIACVLDQSGMIKNAHVLETGAAAMTAKVLTALNSWKFRPVLRNGHPIEVNAIVGFNIDTSDRY